MTPEKALFSANMKKRRLELNISQAQLGEMLSYSGKAISKWESGHAFPPAEVLPKLARALDTDLNSLFDFKQPPSYFLGIDGGGTKTKFLLTDDKGNILKALALGPCSPTGVGVEKSISVLQSGIDSICKDIPFYKISVHAGVAGCGIGKYANLIASAFESKRFSSFKVSSDADNIISAALGKNDGIICILGTGSVVYSCVNGIRRQIGGYGYLIGDVFSGTELGRACLEAVFYDLDGSRDHTLLTQMVTADIGSGSSDMLNDLYAKGRTYMASFAHYVFEAAEKNDAAADAILQKNITGLALQINAALKNISSDKKVPVFLAGGLTNTAPLFLDKLKAAITDSRLLSVEILEKEPVEGAVLLAGAPCVMEEEHA